jgi:hypothetical protein
MPSCTIIGMSWASVSPTVLPLAGVVIVIGACGTLLGQHLVMRVDARREAAKQASDQRSERKEAIIGSLAANRASRAAPRAADHTEYGTGDEERAYRHRLRKEHPSAVPGTGHGIYVSRRLGLIPGDRDS